jgi:hypothetical protein
VGLGSGFCCRATLPVARRLRFGHIPLPVMQQPELSWHTRMFSHGGVSLLPDLQESDLAENQLHGRAAALHDLGSSDSFFPAGRGVIIGYMPPSDLAGNPSLLAIGFHSRTKASLAVTALAEAVMPLL